MDGICFTRDRIAKGLHALFCTFIPTSQFNFTSLKFYRFFFSFFANSQKKRKKHLSIKSSTRTDPDPDSDPDPDRAIESNTNYDLPPLEVNTKYQVRSTSNQVLYPVEYITTSVYICTRMYMCCQSTTHPALPLGTASPCPKSKNR